MNLYKIDVIAYEKDGRVTLTRGAGDRSKNEISFLIRGNSRGEAIRRLEERMKEMGFSAKLGEVRLCGEFRAEDQE